jgi:two-component system response regulator ChvI
LGDPARSGQKAQRPDDAAYNDHIVVDGRTIDSQIKRLRKKLKSTDDGFDMV